MFVMAPYPVLPSPCSDCTIHTFSVVKGWPLPFANLGDSSTLIPSNNWLMILGDVLFYSTIIFFVITLIIFLAGKKIKIVSKSN